VIFHNNATHVVYVQICAICALRLSGASVSSTHEGQYRRQEAPTAFSILLSVKSVEVQVYLIAGIATKKSGREKGSVAYSVEEKCCRRLASTGGKWGFL